MDGDPLALPSGMKLVRRLGAGAFGEVFLVSQTAIGRLVAVKRILPHALSDSDNVERFRREARVLAATDVRTAVRVYDLRVDEAGALLIMEYVPGETLAERLERGPLPFLDAVRALTDVADALRHMAERGIVHRDVKPGNVFLLPDGHAKLGDFGLARAIADDSSFRTAGGAPIGTPAYFPPEVSQGHGTPDARSDAYSFAVMAYETLTAQRPFEAPDALALIIAHWERPPRSPADALPGMPRPAVDLLLRGLSKRPAERPLPHELVGGLQKIDPASWPAVTVAPRPAGSRQDPTIVRRGFEPPAAGTAPPPLPPPMTRVKRRRGALLVALAVVVAVVAGALLLPRLLTPGPLVVESVAVAVDTTEGECPAALYRFLATVATNGEAGEVTFRWRQPDGALTPEQKLQVPDGRTAVEVGLDFTMRGSTPLEGDAELLISEPVELTAGAAVAYSCLAP